MKRTKIFAFSSIVLLAAAVLLAACGSPEDETAYITISLGASTSRAAISWMPNSGIEDVNIPHDIKIGGTTVATGVHINEDAKLKRPVSAGTHTVEVRGYDPSDTAKLISYAEATVTVAAGQTASCPMKLCQAFETSTTGWNDACAAIEAGGGGNPDRICYIFVNEDVTAIATTASFGTITGIAVNIRGTGKITLTSGPSNVLLRINAGQTVNLEGVYLEGLSTNGASLINVQSGTFNMESGKISGNGGVVIGIANGTFNMSGGEISGNEPPAAGAAIVVGNGTFNMTGGSIKNNGNTSGARGVNVSGSIFFNMSGTAKIINNGNATSTVSGGGVYILNGTFNMSGNAEISGNYANSGGGVGVQQGTFNMTGGTITGNTAANNGGGVYVTQTSGTATFDLKSLGLVKGNTANAGTDPGNEVYVDSGTFLIDGDPPDPADPLNDGIDYYWP